ncbi:MAG: potassium channel protein [Gammaproteobacteria bacterium]|nr:potassium channel protein [Gammaproteobacteria bacterium]
MTLQRLIVQRCYALADSERYASFKGFFYDLVENPQSKIRPYFDVSMLLLVLASILMLTYEFHGEAGIFGDGFDTFAVTIFLFEYLLRLWLCSDSHKVVIEHYEESKLVSKPYSIWPSLIDVIRRKWRYMITPLAIIDLLAIIPSYRPVKFLRIFLLFRLLKLFRYTRSVNEFTKVLADKRFELMTLGVLLSFVVFMSSTAIFFFEAKQVGGEIDGFFDAIYWSLVTISTVGYGDITPQSNEGKAVSLVLIICGIGFISLMTSVIVTAMSGKIRQLRDSRVFTSLEKYSDGYSILCGYGRMGRVVAQHLAASKTQFVVIEKDPVLTDEARQSGYLVVQGNAEDSVLLEKTGIRDRAGTILCLSSSDVTNVYITLSARYLSPDLKIIARVNHRDSVDKFYRAGANNVVAPLKVVGQVIDEYVGQPAAFQAIGDMLSSTGDFGIDTIPVMTDGPLVGRRVGTLDFNAKKLQLFGVITHGDREITGHETVFDLKSYRFIFNPPAFYSLEEGDELVVSGHEQSVAHVKRLIEQDRF